jgi:hypothetical protein
MNIKKFFEVLGILFAENNNIEIKSMDIKKIQEEAS